MKKLKIKEPIWAGRCIGIADGKLKEDLLIDIIYLNADGNRLFPNTYIIRKGTLSLSRYPSQEVSGYTLKIIPIKDLEIFKEGKIAVSKSNLEQVNKYLENIELKGQSEMFKGK